LPAIFISVAIMAANKKKADWTKLEAEYVSGNISYANLADKYNIRLPTLKEHASKNNWYKKRTINHTKTIPKIVEKVNEVNKELVVKEVNNTLKMSLDMRNKSIKALNDLYNDLFTLKTKPYSDNIGQSELILNIERMSKSFELYDRIFRRAANIDTLKITEQTETGYTAMLKSIGAEKLNEILNDPEAPDVE
jgi:hypothetical protein